MNALEFMITKYVSKNDKTGNRVQAVKRKTKSSLEKNIYADEMTWKTFIDLLFNFLNVVKIDISIKLTHANGQETIHSVKVNNSEGEYKGGHEPDKEGTDSSL